MLKKTAIKSALSAVLLCASYSAQAADVNAGDVLTITVGTTTYHSYYGTVSDVTSGSYFGIDLNGDSKIQGVEKIALSQGTVGLPIGAVTLPGDFHAGPPQPGDTNTIDTPWAFFGNTGLHHLTAPVSGDTTNGLNMSGWTVAWATISSIPMGTGAWQPLNCADLGCSGTFSSSIAHFSWNGVYNNSYTLNYTATVPPGHPSGFGGVQYYLHLEGIVLDEGDIPPTTKVEINLPGGDDYECNAGTASVSAEVDITTTDPADILNVSWTLDGAPAGTGNTVNVTAELGSHTLNVHVDTQDSGEFDASAGFDVEDTEAPVISAAFVDSKSGEVITTLGSDGNNGGDKVTAQYSADDACEGIVPATAVQGTHVVDGAQMYINLNNGKLLLDGIGDNPTVELDVTASDSAGNTAQKTTSIQ